MLVGAGLCHCLFCVVVLLFYILFCFVDIRYCSVILLYVAVLFNCYVVCRGVSLLCGFSVLRLLQCFVVLT